MASVGAGGMGEVYRALDTRLGRQVAIKVLPDAFADDPERIARFEREARALAAVDHPGIATIHELERHDGVLLLVLELIEGESLAARLRRGPFEIEDAMRIGAEIAAAMAAAHDADILHRDLKQGSLWSAPFDVERLEITGLEEEVLSSLLVAAMTGLASYALSREGTFVACGGGLRRATMEVAWIDRSGTTEPLDLPGRHYLHPRIDPEGKRIVLEIRGTHDDLWLHEMSTATLTRLTFDGDNLSPLWSPDGSRIAFAHHTDEPPVISWMPVDVPGVRNPLTEPDHVRCPTSWSPDGATIAYTELDSASGSSIGLLSLGDPQESSWFQSTPADERDAVFSPDGEWIAFALDESGRFEVYVRPVEGRGKWLVSSEGGREPVWERDGSALYYRQGSRIFRMGVELEPAFRASPPTVVAEGTVAESEFGASYDVAPDGRILVVREVEQDPMPSELELVVGGPHGRG